MAERALSLAHHDELDLRHCQRLGHRFTLETLPEAA
jgi:hypothetical protein